MNWKLFGAAALIVAAALVKVGVPLVAVVGGVALAGFLSWLTRRPNGRPSAGGTQ